MHRIQSNKAISAWKLSATLYKNSVKVRHVYVAPNASWIEILTQGARSHPRHIRLALGDFIVAYILNILLSIWLL
jgi:hypothetical protein